MLQDLVTLFLFSGVALSAGAKYDATANDDIACACNVTVGATGGVSTVIPGLEGTLAVTTNVGLRVAVRDVIGESEAVLIVDAVAFGGVAACDVTITSGGFLDLESPFFAQPFNFPLCFSTSASSASSASW